MSPMRWACESLNSAEFSGRSFGTTSGKGSFLKIGPFSMISGLIGNIARILIKPKDTSTNTKIKTSSVNADKSKMSSDTKNRPQTSSSVTVTTSGRDSSKHHDPQTHRLRITEGDRVMESLGMKHSSVKHGNYMLLRLISFHLVVSLFGLIFQPKST